MVPATPDPLLSYAQNYEDVRLYKALHSLGPRTYIDVGAAHPVRDSVTRLLHDRGWTGLNIEPGPLFDELAANRLRDVNIRAVVSRRPGTARFAVASPNPELSALAEVFTMADAVESVEVVEADARRLEEILDEQWTLGDIGVLKIDVEGAESEVIESNDWARFRPWVVVVEAIAPGTHEPTHASWEPALAATGYRFAHFDGVNRFYARDDHPELVEMLAAPVSAADYVIRHDVASARERVRVLEGAVEMLQMAQHEAGLAVADFRRSVAEREAQTLGRLASLDADAKEARISAATMASAVGERDARLADLGRHVSALTSEVTALKLSRVVRVGFAVHRVFAPTRPVLAVVAPLVRRIRRRRLSTAARMRRAYATHTSTGRILETVRSGRPRNVVVESGLAVSSLHAVLRDRRSDGARLLSSDEASLIESTLLAQRECDTLDVRPGDELLELAVTLARSSTCRAKDAGPMDVRNLVLVDGRALQSEARTGTGRHSRAVLREIIGQLPEGTAVAFLPCHAMEPIGPDDTSLATETWDPMKLNRVALYVQLAPFINASDDGDLEILLDPTIRKVSIFLDDIQGMNPRYFLTNEWEFWFYQLGVERLRFAHSILALSETSAAELRAILANRADAPEIIVSGAVNGLSEPGALPANVAALGDFIVTVGNPIVHKNLAAAVAGLSRMCGRPGGPGMVVMSSSNPAMIASILDLALELGVPPAKVIVTGSIPDDQVAAILREAAVVVIPSYHEGFSLPVLEALDSGTPLALSRIDAHRELMGDGDWMFDPADPVDLARAVAGVLASPETILAEQRDALASRYDSRRLSEAVARAIGPALPRDTDPELVSANDAVLDRVCKPEPADRSMLSLCKVCEVEDFADHRLRLVMRDVFAHEVVRFGDDFPTGREYRKYWEIAMAVLAFKQTGLLHRDATILGVGAGNEATCFWLTRHAGRVIATDLYESPGWQESASTSMMTNPEWHWPFPWEPDRLDVRHMDALDLDLPDCSVDGIFSSSSVEHFGSHAAVARSLDEAHRVLRPGGILSVSTEFRLSGPPPGIPGALMFDRADIESLFVGNRRWEMIDPFDHLVSRRTIETASPFTDQLRDQLRVIDRYGGLFTHITEYARYPHVALHIGTRMFTSMHIALRKIP